MKFGMVTQTGPLQGQAVKISNFSKTKMAAAAILKNHKNRNITQRIGRSSQNLARLCKMGLLTAQTVKKIEFPKSKMADGRQYQKD